MIDRFRFTTLRFCGPRLAQRHLRAPADPWRAIDQIQSFIDLQQDDANMGSNAAELLLNTAAAFEISTIEHDELFMAADIVRKKMNDDDCKLLDVSRAYQVVGWNHCVILVFSKEVLHPESCEVAD